MHKNTEDSVPFKEKNAQKDSLIKKIFLRNVENVMKTTFGL